MVNEARVRLRELRESVRGHVNTPSSTAPTPEIFDAVDAILAGVPWTDFRRFLVGIEVEADRLGFVALTIRLWDAKLKQHTYCRVEVNPDASIRQGYVTDEFERLQRYSSAEPDFAKSVQGCIGAVIGTLEIATNPE